MIPPLSWSLLTCFGRGFYLSLSFYVPLDQICCDSKLEFHAIDYCSLSIYTKTSAPRHQQAWKTQQMHINITHLTRGTIFYHHFASNRSLPIPTYHFSSISVIPQTSLSPSGFRGNCLFIQQTDSNVPFVLIHQYQERN